MDMSVSILVQVLMAHIAWRNSKDIKLDRLTFLLALISSEQSSLIVAVECVKPKQLHMSTMNMC